MQRESGPAENTLCGENLSMGQPRGQSRRRNAILTDRKQAKREPLYHLLWFLAGATLGVASFRQKLFLREAAVSRFWASVGHRDSCPYRKCCTENWRRSG